MGSFENTYRDLIDAIYDEFSYIESVCDKLKYVSSQSSSIKSEVRDLNDKYRTFFYNEESVDRCKVTVKDAIRDINLYKQKVNSLFKELSNSRDIYDLTKKEVNSVFKNGFRYRDVFDFSYRDASDASSALIRHLQNLEDKFKRFINEKQNDIRYKHAVYRANVSIDNIYSEIKKIQNDLSRLPSSSSNKKNVQGFTFLDVRINSIYFDFIEKLLRTSNSWDERYKCIITYGPS